LKDDGRCGSGSLVEGGKGGGLEAGGEQGRVLIDCQKQVCQTENSQQHNYRQDIQIPVSVVLFGSGFSSKWSIAASPRHTSRIFSIRGEEDR